MSFIGDALKKLSKKKTPPNQGLIDRNPLHNDPSSGNSHLNQPQGEPRKTLNVPKHRSGGGSKSLVGLILLLLVAGAGATAYLYSDELVNLYEGYFGQGYNKPYELPKPIVAESHKAPDNNAFDDIISGTDTQVDTQKVESVRPSKSIDKSEDSEIPAEGANLINDKPEQKSSSNEIPVKSVRADAKKTTPVEDKVSKPAINPNKPDKTVVKKEPVKKTNTSKSEPIKAKDVTKKPTGEKVSTSYDINTLLAQASRANDVGDYATALYYYQQVAKIRNIPGVYHNIALMQMNLGHGTAALLTMINSDMPDEDISDILFDMIDTGFRNQIDSLIPELLQKDRTGSIYYAAGYFYEMNGELSKASMEYRKAMIKSGYSPSIVYAYARCQDIIGNLSEALSFYSFLTGADDVPDDIKSAAGIRAQELRRMNIKPMSNL